MTHNRWQSQRGVTLIDTIVVVALISIVAGITIPTLTSSVDRMRLGQAARQVEREMQTAKSRAVSKGRAMRVHFNCPAVGQYRITELIGTVSAPAAADSAADRCDRTKYPYPAADTNPLTLPNHDGPVQSLDDLVSFDESQTIEFWPDGTAHYVGGGATNPWPMIPTAGIVVRLRRDDNTSTISVNGLGKILLEQ